MTMLEKAVQDGLGLVDSHMDVDYQAALRNAAVRGIERLPLLARTDDMALRDHYMDALRAMMSVAEQGVRELLQQPPDLAVGGDQATTRAAIFCDQVLAHVATYRWAQDQLREFHAFSSQYEAR